MERGGERGRAAARRMAHVGAAERAVRDAADGDDLPARRELVGEDAALARPRGRVGARFEISVPGCVGTTFQRSTSSLEPELGEDAVDDRRRRLGRPAARSAGAPR